MTPVGTRTLKRGDSAQSANHNTPIPVPTSNSPILGIEALLGLVALTAQFQAIEPNAHSLSTDASLCLDHSPPASTSRPVADLAASASSQSPTTPAPDYATARSSDLGHPPASGGDQ